MGLATDPGAQKKREQRTARKGKGAQRKKPPTKTLRKQKNPPRFRGGFFVLDHRVEEISVLGRPGSDLLFQVLRLSTIGAGEFNGRVRDGIGFRLPAKTTRSAKNGNEASAGLSSMDRRAAPGDDTA
jgi:hypothetical protein